MDAAKHWHCTGEPDHSFYNLASAENGLIEPETAAGDTATTGELDLYMGVKLTLDGVYLVGSSTNFGKWSDLVSTLNAQNVAMAGGATKVYVLSWDLASDLKAPVNNLFGDADDTQIDDNLIQSDSITLDITFTLTQA